MKKDNPLRDMIRLILKANLDPQTALLDSEVILVKWIR